MSLTEQGFYTDINYSKNVDEHIEDLKFYDNDEYVANYSETDFEVSNQNIRLHPGTDYSNRMRNSYSKKKENRRITNDDFVNIIQGGLDYTQQKRDSTIADNQPSETIKVDGKLYVPAENKKTNLIDVLKHNGDETNKMLLSMLKQQNDMLKLMKQQNEISHRQIDLLAEKIKVLEAKEVTQRAKSFKDVEALTSIAQSLEYLPALIEAIQIANKRQIEVQNIANSHLMQKNVNDVVVFDEDQVHKDADLKAKQDMAQNLSGINTTLGSVQGVIAQGNISKQEQADATKKIATSTQNISNSTNNISNSTSNIAKETKSSSEFIKGILDNELSRNVYYENGKSVFEKQSKVLDDEEEDKSFLDSVSDVFTGLKDEFLDDFDIFEYVLDNTQLGGKKDE